MGLARDEPTDTKALVGTPSAVVERLGRFAEAGATHADCQLLDLGEIDQLEVIAGEVAAGSDRSFILTGHLIRQVRCCRPRLRCSVVTQPS